MFLKTSIYAASVQLGRAAILNETPGRRRHRSFAYQAYLDHLKVGTDLEPPHNPRPMFGLVSNLTIESMCSGVDILFGKLVCYPINRDITVPTFHSKLVWRHLWARPKSTNDHLVNSSI